MYLYKTAYEYAEAEIVIEKSRFIARVMPIESYEDGQAFVAAMKQEYKSATHNVPAIVFGKKQEMQWASDDGEPSGTSGMPMLKMIADQGITNIAVVVTRYFGGIKLGTGGLSRAYTAALKAGLEASGICGVSECTSFTIQMDYSFLAVIQNAEKNGMFTIKDIEYTESIKLNLVCLSENSDEVLGIIMNLTHGQMSVIQQNQSLEKFKI